MASHAALLNHSALPTCHVVDAARSHGTLEGATDQAFLADAVRLQRRKCGQWPVADLMAEGHVGARLPHGCAHHVARSRRKRRVANGFAVCGSHKSPGPRWESRTPVSNSGARRAVLTRCGARQSGGAGALWLQLTGVFANFHRVIFAGVCPGHHGRHDPAPAGRRSLQA